MAIIIYNKLGAGSTLKLSCSGVNSPALANGKSWVPSQTDLQQIFAGNSSGFGVLTLGTPLTDTAASVKLPSDDRVYDFELKVSPMTDDKAKEKKK